MVEDASCACVTVNDVVSLTRRVPMYGYCPFQDRSFTSLDVVFIYYQAVLTGFVSSRYWLPCKVKNLRASC